MAAGETERGESVPHALKQFVQQSGEQMAAEYRRIVAEARADPGTAGDEGEGNWASLLEEWLPKGYHVTTKGRILSESGYRSPQVDVVVLSPAYPPALRTKKTYLAAGVVAAFECKLTLRPAHIKAAVKTAAEIRQNLLVRGGTPYRDLFSPLIYGLLAHSHSWKRPGSAPVKNVDSTLRKADSDIAKQPREMLDLLCVADLGTWRVLKWSPGSVFPVADDLTQSVTTSFVGPLTAEARQNTPIGVLLAELLRRMAWEHRELRPLADYWRWAGMSVGASSPRSRSWDIDEVYSPKVLNELPTHELLRGPDLWDEWATFLV